MSNLIDSSKFLAETEYCDLSNKSIQEISQRFIKISSNEKDLARNLFYYVRDHTFYTIGNWSKKASETLNDGNGSCTNSANLLVALLRASNIPAGYGVMEVIGPEYFGPIALPKLARHASKKSKHVYCFVFLNNKWLKCDPSDDEPLALSTQHLNPQSKVVDWDGENHAMLNLHLDHIIKDEGPLSNIDHIIRKKQRFSLALPVYIGNLYIEFLRKEGFKISTVNELEPEFMKWLCDKHFFKFLLAKVLFYFSDLIHKIKNLY